MAKEDECERKPKKKTKPVVIKAFEVFEPFRGELWPTPLAPVYGPPFSPQAVTPVYGPPFSSLCGSLYSVSSAMGHGTAAVEALKRAATGSAFKSVVVDKVRTLWPLWLTVWFTLQINA